MKMKFIFVFIGYLMILSPLIASDVPPEGSHHCSKLKSCGQCRTDDSEQNTKCWDNLIKRVGIQIDHFKILEKILRDRDFNRLRLWMVIHKQKERSLINAITEIPEYERKMKGLATSSEQLELQSAPISRRQAPVAFTPSPNPFK